METSDNKMSKFGIVNQIAGLVATVLLVVLLILMNSLLNKSADKIDRLSQEIHSLRFKVDSLDKTIQRDTTKISHTRETVKVIDRGIQEVRANVATMPADELARVFRDSALKYGRR